MNDQLFDIHGKLNHEYPLVKFDHTKKSDWWKVRDAFEGLQIFGGIGSGKSSGSGKTIAKSFLRNGLGGLVMCAKPDEKKTGFPMPKKQVEKLIY